MTRLLSLFFALVALVSLLVAGADAYVDRQHERWPATSAVVKSADVRAVHAATRNGGGIWYHLHASVIAGGRSWTIRSSSARGADVMTGWIGRHRDGTSVEIRIDPSNPDRAELVNPEGLPMPRHPKEDLILAAVAAGASVVFWLIPIPPRRAQSPDRNPPSAR